MTSSSKKPPQSGQQKVTRLYPLPQLADQPLPADHYDPFGEPACECWLCVEWRERLEAADAASKAVTGHSRSCMCEGCRERRRREIRLLVAENIRDLWTELCWAAWMEGWDQAWTRWALEELTSPDKPIGWWSSQVTHMPMAFWYARWDGWRKARGIELTLKPVQENLRNL